MDVMRLIRTTWVGLPLLDSLLSLTLLSDGFTNSNGLGLTAADSTSFLRALATEAAKYGMSTGLKNAQSILGSVADIIQFAVNEECRTVTKDCGVYDDFVAQKPVFHGSSLPSGPLPLLLQLTTSIVEYISSHSGNTVSSNYDGYQGMSSDQIKAAYCFKDNPTQTMRFSTIIKTLALDGWVLYCDGKSATTPALAGSNEAAGEVPEAFEDEKK